MRSSNSAVAILLVCPLALALAQSARFDVVAIKPFAPPPQELGRKAGMGLGMRGGPGTNDPGEVTFTGSLKSLIIAAHSLRGYQVSGPSWLDYDLFLAVAKVPAGISREDLPSMWKNVLVERFQMQAHQETRKIDVYELVVGKNGARLSISPPLPPAGAQNNDGPVRFTIGADGCPVLSDGRRGASTKMLPAGFQMCAARMTIDSLTHYLNGFVDRPIIDRTNLKDKYDFKLEFSPETNTHSSETPDNALPAPAPSLFVALQNQLGLRLAPGAGDAEVLVIDSISRRPTSN